MNGSLNYSILVNTCDKYSDAWIPFLQLLKIQWKGDFPTIYFNTERKMVSCPGMDIKTVNLPNSETVAWGKRLLHCLSKIQSDYILMMLEDFYYESEIKTEYIENTLDIMRRDNKILAFQFVPAGECNIKTFIPDMVYYDKYAKRNQFGKFKIIAGPTLWRKSDLIKLTMEYDSPWDWEYFGSFRTWFYGKDVYCWYNQETPLFDYDVLHGGAIHRGAWVGYKMREIEKKFDIQINMEERTVIEDWMVSENQMQPLPWYKRINSIAYNRFKIIYNILLGIFLRK